MSNLEKLNLMIGVVMEKTFMNGDHLGHLNQFAFDIRSCIHLSDEFDFPSNDDIRRTFDDWKTNRILSHVDCFERNRRALCRVYSCPYQLKYYHSISNSFPRGFYEHVRDISLFDERPFEHEFFSNFFTISIGEKTSSKKSSIESNNNNQQSLLLNILSSFIFTFLYLMMIIFNNF